MTPTADLIDRMSRLASRREQEGIYTDAALVSESAARLAKAERALEEAKAEIERMTPRYVAYDYLESPARREMAEARVSELERALEEWEDAAKATDIYEYLTDALARMGTVGPKGIRQMVAYCASLQKRAATAERALEEAERVIKPFADVAREISDETGVPEYALSDNRFVSMTLGECRAARKWMEERHD